LCCLSYEFETYCSLRKGLPKCGKRVQCGCVDGEVVKVNVLNGTVTIKQNDDSIVQLKGDEIAPENVSDRIKKPQPTKGEIQAQDAKNKAQQGQNKQRRNRPVDVKERKKEKPQ
jgi:hypothetical protein